MPRYLVLRKVPGATDEDIDAAALRAIWCLPEFPSLRWVRSYWDRELEELRCIYDGPDPQLIREHAANSQIPCDEVRAVTEFGPELYLGGGESVAVEPAPGEEHHSRPAPGSKPVH